LTSAIPIREPTRLPPVNEEGLTISIYAIEDHIEKLKQPVLPDRTDVTGFHLEFNYIDEKSEATKTTDFTTASLEVNSKKNRYQNVLAQEDTRVKLAEKEGSDYVNANFINGQIPGSEKAYIASQGPVQTILLDFWRMVWESNSCIVLMLTKEVESMRLKCDCYWPELETPLELETMKITLQEKTDNDELSIRKLLLENSETNESRVITQFQYTAWPDHGVPVSTAAFLELAADADKANATKGPILVHCSAGIGRTGTFCTIHSTLERIKKELQENPKGDITINIPEVVLAIRKQRQNMVQTVEQYEFCYLAINDGVKELLKKHGIVSPRNNKSFILA